MIDCDNCGDPIGSPSQPIFVTPEEATLCRACHWVITGHGPAEAEGQICSGQDGHPMTTSIILYPPTGAPTRYYDIESITTFTPHLRFATRTGRGVMVVTTTLPYLLTETETEYTQYTKEST